MALSAHKNSLCARSAHIHSSIRRRSRFYCFRIHLWNYYVLRAEQPCWWRADVFRKHSCHLWCDQQCMYGTVCARIARPLYGRREFFCFANNENNNCFSSSLFVCVQRTLRIRCPSSTSWTTIALISMNSSTGWWGSRRAPLLEWPELHFDL